MAMLVPQLLALLLPSLFLGDAGLLRGVMPQRTTGLQVLTEG
jgi:hypothetical protein